MAFKIEQLKRRSQLHLPTAKRVASFWDHATEDAVATVMAAGYFNDARHHLEVGDAIFSKAGIGGTAVFAVLNVTAVPASGDITVAADEVVGGQAAVTDFTDSSGGTPADTMVAIGSTHDVDRSAEINNNFASIATKLNAVLARLRSAGTIQT